MPTRRRSWLGRRLVVLALVASVALPGSAHAAEGDTTTTVPTATDATGVTTAAAVTADPADTPGEVSDPASGDAVQSVAIRYLDTLAHPTTKLTVSVLGPTVDLSELVVTENGVKVSADVVPILESDQARATVLVLDTSASTGPGDLIGSIRDAALAFIEQKAPTDEIAILTIGGSSHFEVGLTTDAEALRAGLERVAALGERRLYDGIVDAGRAFVDVPELQPNIVLLLAGSDQGSTATSRSASAALDASHAAVFVTAVFPELWDTDSLAARAARSGGAFATVEQQSDLPGLFRSISQTLENQFVVSYRSTVADQGFLIGVDVRGVSTTTRARPGTVVTGVSAAPAVTPTASTPSFFGSSDARLVIIGLVGAAVMAFLVALVLIFTKERDGVADRLSHYTDEGRRLLEEGSPEGLGRFTESGVVKRAVKFTENFANRNGILEKVEHKLDQADLPMRPAEAFTLYLASIVIVAGLGLVLAGGLLAAVLLTALVVTMPILALNFLRKRRLRRFSDQLPDSLQLLSSTLRAGYSLLQGVDAVAKESKDPMGKELQRVLVEARLGRPIEDALDDMADRMDSIDFKWAVMAIRIQREVGGNLAELLQTVGETMILRERMRREIKALTAEGQISSIVMGLLPLGLGAMLYGTAPEYIGTLFSNTIGIIVLTVSGISAFIGFLWIKKMINIDV